MAQSDKKKKIVQLTGIIISADSMQAVSYTSILIAGTNRGTMADASGYFSLVITSGDTLKFSSVGYQTETKFNIELNSGNAQIINILWLTT